MSSTILHITPRYTNISIYVYVLAFSDVQDFYFSFHRARNDLLSKCLLNRTIELIIDEFSRIYYTVYY